MSSELPGVIGVFDEVAASYDSVGVDFFTPMGAELVRRAGISPGDQILDVGCGRGAVLLPAAEAAGPTGRVVGIDLAPGMVALTAAATAHLPAVTVQTGDAQSPDFPPGTFDVVTAGMVVFFLPDPAAALAAYRELLRPGGRLVFSTFKAYDPHYPQAMRALGKYAVNADPPAPVTDDFTSDETIRAALSDWSRVRITGFSQVSRFADTEHWLAWVASHGGRRLTRAIPPERLAAATADAGAVLAQMRTPEGGLELTTTIRITVADR